MSFFFVQHCETSFPFYVISVCFDPNTRFVVIWVNRSFVKQLTNSLKQKVENIDAKYMCKVLMNIKVTYSLHN